MTLNNFLDTIYEKSLSEVIELSEDQMYDFVIEYKDLEGKTIRHSWLDRDNRLQEYHKETL